MSKIKLYLNTGSDSIFSHKKKKNSSGSVFGSRLREVNETKVSQYGRQYVPVLCDRVPAGLLDLLVPLSLTVMCTKPGRKWIQQCILVATNTILQTVFK